MQYGKHTQNWDQRTIASNCGIYVSDCDMFFCPDGKIPEFVAPCEAVKPDKSKVEDKGSQTPDNLPEIPNFPIYDHAPVYDNNVQEYSDEIHKYVQTDEDETLCEVCPEQPKRKTRRPEVLK